MTPFNKPYFTGKEQELIAKAISSGKISGNGTYSQKCQDFIKDRYQLKKVLLTSSCTDALEMAALLCEIGPGDEVIVPSYTFVSTANAFALRGATIVFADSVSEHPNISPASVEKLITKKTKAIVPVHYAGIACDMESILQLASNNKLSVIEDAAHAIDARYKGRLLGSMGTVGTCSFHDTKNIICGEGGAIFINDETMIERAEIVREKGTNRSDFLQGKTDKYDWVDLGSSYLPSELSAAFLFAQLAEIDLIQHKRKQLWNLYNSRLQELKYKGILLPHVPESAEHNAHIFYLVCRSKQERDKLGSYLKSKEIQAYFHYQALHKSPYAQNLRQTQKALPNAEKFTDCLIRLPLYADLTTAQTEQICDLILDFFNN